MKKKILLIALVFVSVVSFGQSIFDTLENMEDVSSFIINKDAFQLLQKFNPDMSEDNEALEVFEMLQNLNELKVFKTSMLKVAKKMEAMTATVVKKANLIELMRFKDADSRAKIYVKTGANKETVSEVIMFVSGVSEATESNSEGHTESVIISLNGIIDVNKLSKLAEKFTK
jgi:sulfur relay (sulfurtransferase) DsrF/TusC family protein